VGANDRVPTRRLAGADRRPCTPPLRAATWNDRILFQPVGVQTRAASTVSAARSTTHGRWYSYDTLLERRPPPRQPVACALGQLVEEQDAEVCLAYLPNHWHRPPTDQPHVGAIVNGVRQGHAAIVACGRPPGAAHGGEESISDEGAEWGSHAGLPCPAGGTSRLRSRTYARRRRACYACFLL
jgi:hypothetical protein